MSRAGTRATATKRAGYVVGHVIQQWLDRVRLALRRDPRLLSTRVAVDKKAVWRSAELPGSGSGGWIVRFGEQVPMSWVAILGAVIVGAVVGEALFPPQQVSSEAATAIIGKCLEITIAIVGIIVPLLILVIEFYGREAGVTDLIIPKAGVLQHVALVLGALLFVALAYARTAALEDFYKEHFPAAIVSAAMVGTLAILIETALFARRTISSLRSEAIYDALEHKLFAQLRQSVDHELDHRLGRRTVEKLARNYAVLIHPIGRYVARQEVALTADTSGVITDIRLDKLESFCAGVTTTMHGKEVKAYLTRSLYDQVQHGQPVAYVPRTEEHPDKLERQLNSALIVGAARPRQPDLKPTLDHLRDMTVRAIEELSEGIFEQLLLLYMSVAEFHTELVSATGSQAPPPASLADFHPEWPFVRFLERDLDVVIDHAIRSESHVFISRTASCLYYIARDALDGKDPRMFQLATGLFQTIYRHAQVAQNARAKDLVELYLTDQLATFALVPALESTRPDPEPVKEVKRFLQILTRAIIELARACVDFKDAQGFANMVRAGEELLERYHPRPQLRQELFSALTSVERAPEGTADHQRAVERQANVGYLLNLEHTFATEWKDTVFLLGAYIVDLYDRGALEQNSTDAFLDIVFPKLMDPATLLHAFSAVVMPPYQRTLFDRMEDTRRAQPLDPQRKYYLFYIFLGTTLLELIDIPESQYEPAFLSACHVDRIRDAAEHIGSNKLKWLWLTGPFFDLDISRFVSFHERTLTSKEDRLQEELVRSDLSEATVGLFAERALAAARGTSALRYWLDEYEALSEVDQLPAEERETISRHVLEEKATFVGKELSGAAAQLGTFMGEQVASAFDASVLHRLLKTAQGAAQPRAMALADAMPASCHWVKQTAPSAGLLVVPVQRTATALHALTEFLYPEGMDGERPSRMVHGFYEGIPVLAVRDNVVGDRILAIDLSQVCSIAVTTPLTEVRILTDQEIQSLMEESPELTERILRLRVRARAWQYFKFERIDSGGLLVVQLVGDQ